MCRNEFAHDSQYRRGPSGKTFNFTFHRRGTDEQLDELGRLMTNVCKLVPGGVVCFLPSYGYLDQVSFVLLHTPCASNNTVIGETENGDMLVEKHASFDKVVVLSFPV